VTVAQACTVLIASADLLPAFTQRNVADDREVLTFSEAQAVRALEEIVRRRPDAIELERQFAATPRGAALIKRIKADPGLGHSEIRIVSHTGESARILPRAAAGAVAIQSPVMAAVEIIREEAPTSAPLDQRGTRRAPRFKLVDGIAMMIDGNAAMVVDLSTAGAQVVSLAILKPNQRVRIGLADDHGALRFNAAIAWAFFEIPPNKEPHYRAGVTFADADASALDGFCHRHKTS
jgi:hypothetical protein